VVVETGAAHGGSALMIASIAPHIGLKQIVSVDTQEVPRPSHPLIRFLTGSSADGAIVSEIRSLVAGRACSLILDSDHNAPHVALELELLGGLVTSGQALIVEDTHVDVLGFRKFREAGGPLRALESYLRSHPEFAEAPEVEPYVTTNYFGYLRRA
jgi:cephalosporin hydroxylase